MTDNFTHHHLSAERIEDKNGPAIMLTQQDGTDDPQTVVLHPWQLRAACEHFEIIASGPQAARTIATLQRRLRVLQGRIDHLGDYLTNVSDHAHADLDYELTYITATMAIADEFCADLEDLAPVTDPNTTASTPAPRQPDRAFVAHGCDSLEAFNQAHKGEFLKGMPDTHEPCREGFRPYRTANGDILGVKV